MTKEEALEFLAEPLLSFEDSMSLPTEEWRKYVKKTLEALKIVWDEREEGRDGHGRREDLAR